MKIFQNIFVYSLLACSLSFCGQPSPTQSTEAQGPPAAAAPTDTVSIGQDQLKLMGLELGRLSYRDMGLDIKATGRLDVPPNAVATLSAPIGGFVKRNDLLPGQMARKGQVLIVLEHPDYVKLQQNYLEAKNQLLYANKELERQKVLTAENVNAAQRQEQAESAYQAAKILVASLEQQLKILDISPEKLSPENIQAVVSVKAPFDGYITDNNVNIGRYVQPNEVLMRMINKEHMHMELQVFERDMLRLHQGQRITANIMGNTGKVYTGKVYLINQQFNEQTKTVNIHGHFDQEDPRLSPGMFVEAVIHADHAPTPTLPDEALIKEGENFYCFRLLNKQGNNFTFVKTPLRRGSVENGFAAVQLAPADTAAQFVVKGAYYLFAQMNKGGEEE